MASFIPVAKASRNCLIATPPKTQKSKEGNVSYLRSLINYNYGTPEKPIVKAAMFEFAICTGRVRQKENNGKLEWKLNLVIKDENDIKGCEELSQGTYQEVYKHRALFKMNSFNPQYVAPESCRGVYFIPTDQETGQVIQGAHPMVSLKIGDRSEFHVVSYVNPDDPNSIKTERIDYKTLQDKEITCSVVMNYWSLFKGSAGVLPQFTVSSCYVLNIADRTHVDHSKSDLVFSFLKENPELLNTLADQLAKLKAGQTVLATNMSSLPGTTINSPPFPQVPTSNSSPREGGLDLTSLIQNRSTRTPVVGQL